MLSEGVSRVLLHQCGTACIVLRSHARVLAAFLAVCLVLLQQPVLAEADVVSSNVSAEQAVALTQQLASLDSSKTDNTALIAQAGGVSGATLGTAALIGGGVKKRKYVSMLTDSLWGNLILELAYDRDPLLGKLSTTAKYMNIGTTAGVAGIAGGTLMQGIWAVASLNPPAGHQDSYVPGITGVALSASTIALFTTRLIAGHQLSKRIRKRQMELRDSVVALLANLENSRCEDASARAELTNLVGDRAANEWCQIWRSTHKLSTEAKRIGLQPSSERTVEDRRSCDASLKPAAVVAVDRTGGGS